MGSSTSAAEEIAAAVGATGGGPELASIRLADLDSITLTEIAQIAEDVRGEAIDPDAMLAFVDIGDVLRFLDQ